MKLCKLCNVEKDETEFYSSGKYINRHCKQCNHKKSKQWYENNKDVKKKSALKHHYKKAYSMSFEDRQQMFDNQQGLCAVCKVEIHLEGPKDAFSAVIDHNHDTGKVRGMLCNRCNQAIGFFKDSVTTIENAIKYLENSRENIAS